jgi:hypothetical protein
LQLHKPKIIGLGCIAILLSVGVYIACAAAVLGVSVIPDPKPLVNVGSYPIQEDIKTYATPGLVLWDLSHGASNGFSTIGSYSEMSDILKNTGFKVDSNKMGILNLDISGYALIILNVSCGATDSSYSKEEADILFEYVNSGGALFLVGEHDQQEYSKNLDVVANLFGIDLANPPYSDGVYSFANHPINNGVNSLNFLAGGTIAISPPAIGVAWYRNDSSIAIAVAEVGKGKVVVVGDSNFIQNAHIGENEKRFVINTFTWLTQK